MARPVQLFVTCLVDLVYPGVGEAAVAALRAAGFEPSVPDDQTCCGQPLYNNGMPAEAAAVARTNIAAFRGDDPIVVPSGSCAWTLRKAYPELLPDDATRKFAGRVVELTELLGSAALPPRALPSPAKIAYQPSCRLLRGLGVDEAPRSLLAKLEGATMVEPENARECCGFGGAFSVRYPELSTTMAADKLEAAKRAGATIVATAEPGCMMHLQCTSASRGDGLRVCHVAELVAESRKADS
jgi:L-lactate dehydrogenase complex protein LldE